MKETTSNEVEKQEKPVELPGCIAYPTDVDCPLEWCRKARGEWCERNGKPCQWRDV